ncbi:MAG: hypothetical protein SFX73_18400 [Kofleriaceae bacterium]|nr:hypothetical protein [Kofleriaceae bacterium]
MRHSTGLSTIVLLGMLFGVPGGAHAQGAAKPRLPPVKHRLTGATQIHRASWGLVAQGSGMLRILPAGAARWETLHQVKKGSLYRVGYDDAGRVIAAWEKEPHFHLFDRKKKQHVTIALPTAPTPEFKYGFDVEDLYFTKDGTGAIVYMHGFLGGRTWSTVAYHVALDRPTEPPTLLFRQSGYALHNSARLATYATPQTENDACEHNSCHPLGTITAWEIDGTKATKRVLLTGAPSNNLSRVFAIAGDDTDRIAVLIQEHPHKRHLLRWHWGDAKAQVRALPAGPTYTTETQRLMQGDDLVEVWLPDDRSLEIRRLPVNGESKITKIPPLPRRTPNDRPLFNISNSFERSNGDLVLYWGEYLVLVPKDGAVQRLDMRSLFKRKGEFTGRVIYVPEPEGFWIGDEPARTVDFVFLTYGEIKTRAQTL